MRLQGSVYLCYFCLGVSLSEIKMPKPETVAVALGLIDLRTIRTFQNFRPLVIRIDQLGRAEALAYSNFEYKPQEVEAKYFLSQFSQLYYRRNRYTIKDDFSKSLYFLDGTLASDIIDAYKENDVIKSFLTDPSKPEIDIEVKNVALEGMQNPPYKARVDFYMVYYSPADHSELRPAPQENSTSETKVALTCGKGMCDSSKVRDLTLAKSANVTVNRSVQ